MLTDALAQGLLTPRDVLSTATHQLWHGGYEEIGTAFAQLVARSDRTRLASLELVRKVLSTHPATRMHPDVARRPGAPAAPPPITHGPHAQAAELLHSVLHGQADGRVGDLAEQVLLSCPIGERTYEATVLLLHTLVYSDNLKKAATWCDRLLKQAENKQANTWLAVLWAIRAEISFRTGELSSATRSAKDALSRISMDAWGAEVGAPLAAAIAGSTMTGDLRAAEQQLNRPVSEAMFQNRAGLHYLYSRGYHALTTGGPHLALSDFQKCGELMASWHMDTPAMIPWRTGAAQALIKLGRTEEARLLTEEQLAMASEHTPRVLGISLRVLAATTRPSGRAKLLRQATDVLLVAGDRLELAQAMIGLANAYRMGNDPTRARMAFRQAKQLVRECQAEPLEQSLPGGRRELADRPGESANQYVATLTDAERRVGQLAVLGHTNREIAGKLHITQSTVEQHLTSTYRKVRIKRRTDLPITLRADVVA
jgi:DNA-binding CsgD family transcriptional regulator